MLGIGARVPIVFAETSGPHVAPIAKFKRKGDPSSTLLADCAATDCPSTGELD